MALETVLIVVSIWITKDIDCTIYSSASKANGNGKLLYQQALFISGENNSKKDHRIV